MIYSRVGIRAAFDTAIRLQGLKNLGDAAFKPDEKAAIQAVSEQLCIEVGTVQECLQPETLHE